MLSSITSSKSLRETALEIWRAGVAAVDSSQLVARQIRLWHGGIEIAGHHWLPRPDSRICVVGGGKAGAGMATGLEQALGSQWLRRTSGWVNVPEDCVTNLQRIRLHGARPAGMNEPTAAGVAGTEEILRQVRGLGPHDLCIMLISGGGSALLPAPLPGISLADKQQITRTLMRGGAPIDELNCVRRALSGLKGGGLLRASNAGLLIALIISDVNGDPLETIASGPTVPLAPDPKRALEILNRFNEQPDAVIPPSVRQLLQSMATAPAEPPRPSGRFYNRVIGNNQTAVAAAVAKARECGYPVVEFEADQPGIAAEEGRKFARRLLRRQRLQPALPFCFVSGGETTVRLAVTAQPRRGGRNQEFALAAVIELLAADAREIAIISGGTDGEDGPTDAAGAVVDDELLAHVRSKNVDPHASLAINDSYTFFEQVNGLLKTGPTHTNVMDLRVGLVGTSSGR